MSFYNTYYIIMKKLGIFLFVIVCSVLGIGYASTLDVGSLLDVGMCSAKYQTGTTTKTWFCLQFTNKSDTTWIINISFVDSEKTLSWKSVCTAFTSGYFSQFTSFSWAVSGNALVIPPKADVIQRGTLSIPTWFVGDINGCVIYSVEGSGEQLSGTIETTPIDLIITGSYVNMFGLLDMRKFSWGNRKLDTRQPLLSVNSPIIVMQLTGKNILVLGIQNTGFINEKYTITGIIYNEYLGQKIYNKSFIVGSGKLSGQDTFVIEYPLDDLPFYKWDYTIDLTIAHTPVEVPGLEITTLPTSITQKISISLPLDMVIMGIVVGGILLWCCIIVIVIVAKKTKTQSTVHTWSPIDIMQG